MAAQRPRFQADTPPAGPAPIAKSTPPATLRPEGPSMQLAESTYLPRDEPVAPIRVLAEDGTLVDGARPDLDHGQTLAALRLMMLARAFDDKCFSLQRQGKLGTFAPLGAQEASVLGPALALEPERDWVVVQYREMPAQLHQGMTLERLALYRRGHPLGLQPPGGANLTVHQVSLAAQLPHAVGLAWGLKLQGKDAVVMTYFGDGASSEGTSTRPATSPGWSRRR